MSDEPVFHRRHLPHYYPPNSVYFVTPRLAGSLPKFRIDEIQEQRELLRIQRQKMLKEALDAARYEQDLLRLDKILQRVDQKSCWLSDPRVAGVVAEAIRYRDGKDYDLIAYSIMPNHMHLVFGIGAPDLIVPVGQIDNLSNKPVSKIMHSLKRHTAREANKILGRTGAFWQDESYDHVIRNSEELERIILYVLHNPVKAGFVKTWRDWKWNYSRLLV
jgi:REP element-mobilizing transposase RayT